MMDRQLAQDRSFSASVAQKSTQVRMYVVAKMTPFTLQSQVWLHLHAAKLSLSMAQ
jgi:hypothetical protein